MTAVRVNEAGVVPPPPPPSLPTALYDWPVPKGRPPQLGDWQDSYKLTLIGHDFDKQGTPPKYDYPNPPGSRPTNVNRGWLDSYKLTLIGQDAKTNFGILLNDDWPNPGINPGRRPTQEFAYQNLLSTLLLASTPTGTTIHRRRDAYGTAGHVRRIVLSTTAPAPLPFALMDWPVPKGRPPQLRDWQDSYKLTLVGHDFDKQGTPPKYDYPNPLGQRPTNVNRGWLDSYKLTLVGRDFDGAFSGLLNDDWPVPLKVRVAFGDLASVNLLSTLLVPPATSPFSQSDWPVPKGRPPQLRDWQDSYKLTLVGHDFDGTFSGLLNDDWPVPKGRPPQLRDWQDSYKLTLVGQDGNANFGVLLNDDWPVPKGRPPQLRDWQDSYKLNLVGQDQLPEQNFDQPVPKGRPPQLRDWTDSYKLSLVGQDQLPQRNFDQPIPPIKITARTFDFFAPELQNTALNILSPFYQDDWPNPTGPQRASDLRTWLQAYNLLSGLDRFYGAPGLAPTFDYPNPRAPIGNVQLKTWTDSFKLELVGQDRFFGAPGEALARDYPNPIGPRSFDLRGFLSNDLLSTLLFVSQPPFQLLDWPVPSGARRSIALATWTDAYKLGLIGRDVLPFENYDWPNPRAPEAVRVPAGILRTWTDAYKRVLVGRDALPFDLTDWPNPKGPISALILRTWPEWSGRTILIPPAAALFLCANVIPDRMYSAATVIVDRADFQAGSGDVADFQGAGGDMAYYATGGLTEAVLYRAAGGDVADFHGVGSDVAIFAVILAEFACKD
jgi:hypothetical protein